MSHHRAIRVLAVDDQEANLRLIDAVLSPRGYDVVVCSSGAEGLARLAEDDLVDLVLLDVLMPGLDGYEVCRRIRAEPATEFLPIVMITASGEQQRARALEAGADDFVTKPFDQSELLARIASLARIKRYHDTIGRQAAELASWNAELTRRVEEQLTELERVSRLRRFLSPQVADLVMADEGLLLSHRREIVVVFFDLRNFTHFAETSEPEEVTQVLGEFHAALGRLIHQHAGTLERFTGDGAMVFFNDPVPCPDPADRAVETALAANRTVRGLAEGWRRRGFDLAMGTGIAQGYATLGRIGFEDRFDYAAIGSVTNLAARLVAAAEPWQVLTTDRVLDALVRRVASPEPLGEITPRGFIHPVRLNDISKSDVARSERVLDETPQRPA
jgi:adenylate cyclase